MALADNSGVNIFQSSMFAKQTRIRRKLSRILRFRRELVNKFHNNKIVFITPL